MCQNVEVELDLSGGLFSFLIVGLADKCITESRERIMSAIKNSGFDSPKTKNHKITVSLVPAGIKKEGVLLDLPISIAYLTATGKIQNKNLNNSIFIGELGLDGSIKQNDSLASVAKFILDNKINSQEVINLYSNFNDEQVDLITELELPNVRINNCTHLQELIHNLNFNNETRNIIKAKYSKEEGRATNCELNTPPDKFKIDNIIGQEKAKRALLISLCGKYNMIISGPPGVGKTMLASSAHQLLPTPNKAEYLELLSTHNSLNRPFRSPHHTSSYSSIVGGGNPITSGEITKAHMGILFLDELPEFNKNIIESLRQPLEQKIIQINRANDTITMPCDTICICAMNQCPCGNRGIPNMECRCTGNKINIYKQKVSKPFLERFHVCINLPYENTHQNRRSRSNITQGNDMFKTINTFHKSNIEHRIGFQWDEITEDLLQKSSDYRKLSMRAMNHIRDISETIALIEIIKNSDASYKKISNRLVKIEKHHITEAISYKEDLFF